MLNKLLLLSKSDIPFEQARLIIHQPTLKEISYIGESSFFSGCQYLTFSKKILNLQDKKDLQDIDDFEILMTIMKKDDIAVKKGKTHMLQVLALLFPQYKIVWLPMSIGLYKDKEQFFIDRDNFYSFRNIVSEMFCLERTKSKASKYNPGGPQAAALVKKFQERERKLAEIKNKGKQKHSVSILSQYMSILAIGLQKDMNQLLQYSVYQLFEEFHRFKMKQSFDMYVQAKMAGARDLEEVENWMTDIDIINDD